MTPEKRKYSLEFKIKAVELSNHRSELQSVALELGIPVKNLSRWKHEYNAGKLDPLNKPIAIRSKEELENIALRKALREVELERDILKKALGIFSRSDK
ncbi:MAG: transposase [Bacteroidetes bacterium]|nr:transposase [Bacteroidota bacterium]MBU1761462.1 transposase [Bacteroidota bacterium]MBU2046387.1 transposase [Bacteroidota bacterium]MBU2375612.1 transposase [Bacteroidota bacterium]